MVVGVLLDFKIDFGVEGDERVEVELSELAFRAGTKVGGVCTAWAVEDLGEDAELPPLLNVSLLPRL